jgi:hypothetical protein
MAKPTHTDLESLLREAERALSQSREHNPWDLGPSSLLVRIRAALGLPTQEKR